MFVADGDLEDLVAWYANRCSGELTLKDYTNCESRPDKLDLMISRPEEGYLECFAMAGVDDEKIDGFVNFYACESMNRLRKRYPDKIIGILIEN